MPGVYDKMSQFILSVKTFDIKYIMQFVAKKLVKCGPKNLFPLIIFLDEFETSNTLGNHGGVYKQRAIYFSVIYIYIYIGFIKVYIMAPYYIHM